MLPKKEEIYEKAVQMWHEDQYRQGFQPTTNPEPSELAENGFIQTARSTLMTDQYRSQTEGKDYVENFTDFRFDTKEGMATTTFINGSRGIGKSDIAMCIAQELHNEGITVIVFDPSCDWVKRSSIEQYFTVKPYSDLPIPETSTIFDISRLTPNGAQRCVEGFSKKLFEFQIDNSAKRFYYIIFEEAQIYFPLSALSSKNTQNTMRLLTVGRNFGVSMCAISQFPALVSKELIKHSQQVWIGCCAEPNTVRYWSGIIGKSAEKLKDLQNGEFVYYCRNKISLTEIAPYESEVCKTQIQIPEVRPTEPTNQSINIIPLAKLFILLGFAVLVLYSLRGM